MCEKTEEFKKRIEFLEDEYARVSKAFDCVRDMFIQQQRLVAKLGESK